nr:MAG TPA: hypothetical protein [Caudoviricetes sp.]
MTEGRAQRCGLPFSLAFRRKYSGNCRVYALNIK